MGSAHPFSVSFAPCFQGILCRSRLFFRMFLDKLFQICADRFIVKQKRRCFSPFLLSPSSRRAWIEISLQEEPRTGCPVALLAEGVDRNREMKKNGRASRKSPSSRRAWIEIGRWCWGSAAGHVALLAEGVDRNYDRVINCAAHNVVALLAEGVDRNVTQTPFRPHIGGVALLAEGVDRNSSPPSGTSRKSRRPPRGGRG